MDKDFASINYIGIDLSGINVAIALVSEYGAILARHRFPFSSGAETCPTPLSLVSPAFRSATSQGYPLPGLSTPQYHRLGGGRGRILIQFRFSKRPLFQMLTERLNPSVPMENDSTCAALGEYVADTGRSSRSMLVIT